MASSLALTGCSDDNEGAIYNSAFNNVSWEQNVISTTTSEESVTVPVMITRNNKSGALTVHYTTSTVDTGIFSDDANGTVTFADGQAVAYVNVTASNLEKGVEYNYTMTLDKESFSDIDTNTNTAQQTIVVNIVSDYTWISGGTATFIDYNFSDYGAVGEVPVQMAKENPSIIRLIKPFQNTYKDDPDDVEYFANGEDIEITLFDAPDAQGNYGSVKNAFIAEAYSIYYDAEEWSNYCYFDYKGDNYYEVGHLLAVSGVPKYITGFDFIWKRP